MGFLSSAVLIVSRSGEVEGGISLWIFGAFAVPIIYSVYNWFAGAYWPKQADIMMVGAAESVFSGLLAIPFMLVLAPPWSDAAPPLVAYWTAAAASILWIIERIAFFTLIREKGAVYTIQAIYVSTPAAVLWAILIFGKPADPWIWVSLAILMLALWLNNSKQRKDNQRRWLVDEGELASGEMQPAKMRRPAHNCWSCQRTQPSYATQKKAKQ